jgi:hypothetical protein
MFWLWNDFDQNSPLIIFGWGTKFKVGVVHSNTGFFVI